MLLLLLLSLFGFSVGVIVGGGVVVVGIIVVGVVAFGGVVVC